MNNSHTLEQKVVCPFTLPAIAYHLKRVMTRPAIRVAALAFPERQPNTLFLLDKLPPRRSLPDSAYRELNIMSLQAEFDWLPLEVEDRLLRLVHEALKRLDTPRSLEVRPRKILRFIQVSREYRVFATSRFSLIALPEAFLQIQVGTLPAPPA